MDRMSQISLGKSRNFGDSLRVVLSQPRACINDMELEDFGQALEALVASGAANDGDCESIEDCTSSWHDASPS
jgi:hypothetical protein